jgi:hypothetical protein
MALFDRKGKDVLEFLIDSFRRKLKGATKKVPSEVVEILQKYSKMELKLQKSQYLGM